MRLRGLEKRRKTYEDKLARKWNRKSLKRLDSELSWYDKIQHSDFVGGRKPERWDIYAWLAGWAPKPRIKLWVLTRLIWPQEDIYEEIFARCPFIGFVATEPEE